MCADAPPGRASRLHCVARRRTGNPKSKSTNPSQGVAETQRKSFGIWDLAKRWTVPPKPVAGLTITGTCVSDEAPVRGRMVQPEQVHQLVNQDVIAYRWRHQHQSPVQTDVAVTAAGAPPRALIPDAHACHDEPVACGQFEQACRQLAACVLSQRAVIFERTKFSLRTRSLPDNPVNVALNERLGLATRAAARNRYS